jgi:hypothetical protein
MRLLDRGERNRDVAEVEVAAVIVERSPAHRLQQNFAYLIPTGDLLTSNSKNAELQSDGTTANAQVHTTPAQLIKHADFFEPPDLNPIEQVFAKIKAWIRRYEPRRRETLWKAIARALNCFPADECRRYLRHCGYAHP